MHTKDGVADTFLNDVRQQVAELMLNPTKPVEGKVYDECGIYYCEV